MPVKSIENYAVTKLTDQVVEILSSVLLGEFIRVAIVSQETGTRYIFTLNESVNTSKQSVIQGQLSDGRDCHLGVVGVGDKGVLYCDEYEESPRTREQQELRYNVIWFLRYLIKFKHNAHKVDAYELHQYDVKQPAELHETHRVVNCESGVTLTRLKGLNTSRIYAWLNLDNGNLVCTSIFKTHSKTWESMSGFKPRYIKQTGGYTALTAQVILESNLNKLMWL